MDDLDENPFDDPSVSSQAAAKEPVEEIVSTPVSEPAEQITVQEALGDDFVTNAQAEPPKPAKRTNIPVPAVPTESVPIDLPSPPQTSSKPSSLPSFEISVLDPVKKTESMSSYMVYTISTKTTAPGYKSPLSVQRRFNHFAWLFNELSAAFPGIIIPPIPEKQTLGRFESEFIDNRRLGLEKFLRRVVAHPTLYDSPDVKLFLEVENIETAIANKKKEKSKGGFFSSLTSSLTDVVANTTLTFAKIPEKDEWFENKRGQLEVLESQLKALYKCVESVVKQRKELAVAAGEFGDNAASMGTSESNKQLANALTHLGEVQRKIKDFYNEQATQDDLLFGSTVDEYVRIIGSIKLVLQTRSKSFAAMQAAEASLIKKREALEKTRAQPTKVAKVGALEKEVEEAEQLEAKAKKEFEDLSKLVREELQRFDEEKVQDFQQSMQAFVFSLMETQKKVISLWKEYLPEVQSLSQATSTSA